MRGEGAPQQNVASIRSGDRDADESVEFSFPGLFRATVLPLRAVKVFPDCGVRDGLVPSTNRTESRDARVACVSSFFSYFSPKRLRTNYDYYMRARRRS